MTVSELISYLNKFRPNTVVRAVDNNGNSSPFVMIREFGRKTNERLHRRIFRDGRIDALHQFRAVLRILHPFPCHDPVEALSVRGVKWLKRTMILWIMSSATAAVGV